MFAEIFGISGAIIIVIAWTWETIEAIKRHKSLVDLSFAALSLIGNTLITIYSWMIQNMIFFWLNFIIWIVIIFEIWYSLHIKKVYKG